MRSWCAPITQGKLADGSGKQTIELPVRRTRFVKITASPRAGQRPVSITKSELALLGNGDSAPAGTVVLPRTGWTATASSQEVSAENGSASNVLDGNRDTYWHSRYSGITPTLPQWITIDMGKVQPVSALTYYARTSPNPTAVNPNGAVGNFEISTSTDGSQFSAPVTSGTWGDYNNVHGTHKVAIFNNTVSARYVRLTVKSTANGLPFASAAEIDLSGPANSAVNGSWGGLITMPTIPVAAAVLPNDTLLSWAAYSKDTFDSSPQHAYTATSSLDLNTGTVTDSTVTQTDHQMFCSGVVALADGRIMVTGGSDDRKVSIYDPASGTWSAGPQMNIARGYQAMTPMANGDAFVLGGSWGNADNDLDKSGEVWNHLTNSWRSVYGVSADAMMTNDAQGQYRADNHMWLFQASNGRIFQAGPSKAMHWINPVAVAQAGNRGGSGDTMAGNAVMYDIDKILTYGGGANYNDSVASQRAFSISISDGQARTTEVAPLKYGRTFSNGIALPNGEVLALGGQGFSEPFSDMDSVLTPELYDPAANTWTSMASAAVPRNYHSTGVLLPDGRDFSGGGGLCGTGCVTNHPNGQIFSPPYLFNADGSPRTRPVLSSAPSTAKNSSTIDVSASGDVHNFVLVRIGVSTHAVDNDQRRVPVSSGALGGGGYSLSIPNANIAVPGDYFLFAMDSNGTPSIAKILNINN